MSIKVSSAKIIHSEITRIFVGEFYEGLFLHIFGGEKLEEEGKEDHLPDVIEREERRLYEVKSSSKYNYYHLRDCQMDDLNFLLTRGEFRGFELFFAFFTYTLSRISKTYEDREELHQALADGTESLLILPYDLVRRVHEEGKSRYDGNKYDNLTKLRRTDIRELLEGLELRTDTSGQIQFDGYTVKPFEVIEVEQ
ncbi:MAG: hypothetical protein AABX59_03480 [Nanoarchaeota archaeon]